MTTDRQLTLMLRSVDFARLLYSFTQWTVDFYPICWPRVSGKSSFRLKTKESQIK